MIKLSSSRLNYTQLTPDDFSSYALLTMDEEVMKYITGRALSAEEAKQRFEKSLEAGKILQDAGYFLVKNSDKGEFIGIVKLVQIADNQYEIGYMVKPECWRMGFASEMTKSMIELAIVNNYSGDLIGIVDPGNPASIKVLTKFGFELFETGQIDGLDAAYYKLKLPYS